MGEGEFDRLLLQGASPGCYVRLVVAGVPCEFVQHLDARMPVVAGGLLPTEHAVGFVHVRIKRHRWCAGRVACPWLLREVGARALGQAQKDPQDQ